MTTRPSVLLGTSLLLVNGFYGPIELDLHIDQSLPALEVFYNLDIYGSRMSFGSNGIPTRSYYESVEDLEQVSAEASTTSTTLVRFIVTGIFTPPTCFSLRFPNERIT
jgi:hypothetical protein